MKKVFFLLILCFGPGLFAQRAGNRLIRLGNDPGGQNAYMSIANSTSYIYYEAKKFDSALYFGSLALHEAEKNDMVSDTYMARFNIIASLIRLKKLPEAQKELGELQQKEFIQWPGNYSQPGNNRFVIHYYTLSGNYQLASNNALLGSSYYDTAINLAHNTQLPELQLYVYRNMAESFDELKDFKTAYECLKKYELVLTDMTMVDRRPGNRNGPLNKEALEHNIKLLASENEVKRRQLLQEAEISQHLQKENILKDSLLEQEKLVSAARAREDSLHNAQLQAEKRFRTELKRVNDLQSAQLRSEKQLRLSLLAGLSIGIVLGAIIFYQYARQRKKNIIIRKQSEELQTLLKEIHHRVKNNMQIVSSLLDLQSFTIKDEGASEAVKESRDRVQSMALIHQNLYQEGNIKSVQIENYIQNLAQNLFDSYNIQKEKIKLRTDIDHLNLDVDTVIPIGLIVNELISNSLKYAFEGKESGELAIGLKEKDHELILEVRDNGAGFPEDLSTRLDQSFGYKLIKAFARKLKARLEIYNDNGACVSMHIAKYKLA